MPPDVNDEDGSTEYDGEDDAPGRVVQVDPRLPLACPRLVSALEVKT
jgi:hypothetical protein